MITTSLENSDGWNWNGAELEPRLRALGLVPNGEARRGAAATVPPYSTRVPEQAVVDDRGHRHDADAERDAEHLALEVGCGACRRLLPVRVAL